MDGYVPQKHGQIRAKSNVSAAPNCIAPNHLGFLTARCEEVRPYIKKGWISGVDYAGLYRDSQVLVLGDTNHEQHAMLGGLESEIAVMKKAGVDDIAIEIPASKKYLESLEAFYATGDKSHIRWISEQTRTPVRFMRFMERAYHEDIRVHFVDMPHEDRDTAWSEQQTSEERGTYMGRRIAQIARQDDSRIVVFTGYDHLGDRQIPDQLQGNKITYKKIGLVTAGQPTPMFPVHTFLGMGASEAVRDEGLQDKLGMVHLDGAYGLDACIHFPRVQLNHAEGNNDLVIRSFGASIGANASDYAVVPLQKGADLPGLVCDMTNMVEPCVHEWEETNAGRIFQFVDSFGISNGQKLFLGVMLENFVRLTMHHGGGSICRMEYDPQARAFGIDTVDTFGYPFDPNADYGPLKRHREVTLDTLIHNFDFSELAVRDMVDYPKSEIRPNPNKPESAYRFLLLASTYATHPERIKIITGPPYSLVVQHNGGRSYVVKLGLDDFELSEVEAGLAQICKGLGNANMLVSNMLYALHRSEDDALKIRIMYRKDLAFMRKLVMDVCPIIYKYNREFNLGVLKSRKQLEYLDSESALEFITKSKRDFAAVVQSLMQIDRRSNKYTQLNKNIFDYRGNLCTFQEAIQKSKDLWTGLAGDLSKIKESIPAQQKSVL